MALSKKRRSLKLFPNWRLVFHQVDVDAIGILDREVPITPRFIPELNFDLHALLFQFLVQLVYVFYLNGQVHALALEGCMEKRLLTGVFGQQKGDFSLPLGGVQQEIKLVFKTYPKTQDLGVKHFTFGKFGRDSTRIEFHRN